MRKLTYSEWLYIGLLAVLLAVLGIIFTGCYISEKETITEPPPPIIGDITPVVSCVSSFTWNQIPGTLAIKYIGQSQPRECLAYQWQLGDSATSRQESPTHTYAVPGVYTVTLITCPTSDFTAPECGEVSAAINVVAPQ